MRCTFSFLLCFLDLNNDNNPPYPDIHRERWYDKSLINSLRHIIINRKRGITYHLKLITPRTAEEWLKKQNEKGLKEGWRMIYADFDNNPPIPVNVIIKYREDDDRIIDCYEINYGRKKTHNHNC
jgi:hypothetical protein